MSLPECHVKIGQIEVAGEGQVLKTVLGSCVGIALFWKKKKVAILAHCLLPYPKPNEVVDQPGRFVTTSIPAMLKILGVQKDELKEIEAVVAGGGQMMEVEQAYTKFIVGDLNLKTAQEELAKHKISVVACVSGGTQGTKMRIEPGTGAYLVEKVPKAA